MLSTLLRVRVMGKMNFLSPLTTALFYFLNFFCIGHAGSTLFHTETGQPNLLPG